MSEIIKRDLDKDVLNLPGSGAAGGMGGGMAAFFNSTLQPGIETVLDTVHFNNLLEGADLIISGEGKIDTQSLRGKVVIGVARRAKNHPYRLLPLSAISAAIFKKPMRKALPEFSALTALPSPMSRLN